MAIRETIQIGEPVLRETLQHVANVEDSRVQQVIADLVDTMRDTGLVGMAACQIGEIDRIFVSEIVATKNRPDIKDPDPLCIYINPEIISVSHETEYGYEGCGSVLNGTFFGKVERPIEVTVQYMDQAGELQEKAASGLLARVIQHEIDHLNGIMFTDKADPLTFVNRDYYLKNIKDK